MVHLALGPGQDGVVVGEHGAARRLAEELPVDPADAGDQPVGRRVRHEVVDAPPGPLCRDDQSAVLLEEPGSHRSSMFSRAVRRPPACRRAVASCRPASVVVATRAASSANSGTHVVGRDRGHVGARCRSTDLRPSPLGHHGKDVSGLHGCAGCHRHRVDPAGRGGCDDVLHLHGLEDGDGAPGAHDVARFDLDPQDDAGERRHEGHRDGIVSSLGGHGIDS